MPSHRRFLALVALAALSPLAPAEAVRFARTPDVSPDGKTLAFSYQGDVWVADAAGGVARAVTTNEAHDYLPLFSPDGRRLAFASNRHGSYDIFVVPVTGGRPTRLTSDSADDLPVAWSADGSSIVFSSSRTAGYPRNSELWSVPAAGGAARPLPYPEAKDLAFGPNGLVAFVRGPGTWYRKGYRGSANDDIWLTDAAGSKFRRLTDFDGQDTAPMIAPDGRTIYYVSERFGTPANVVAQELSNGQPVGQPRPLTRHRADAVRRARLSADGSAVVYECGPDLFALPTAGGDPRRVELEANADEKSNAEKTTTLTRGLTNFSMPADEKFFVAVAAGELWLTPIAGGKAKRLTDSPANDHGPAVSPDGKFVLFLSDRGGAEDVYRLEGEDDPDLLKATKFRVRQLTTTPDPEAGLTFAPDGKTVAFLSRGRLWTMNPDGTDAKVVVGEQAVGDFDWSPDGKHFVYARADGHFASELYVAPAAGGKAVNVTRYATSNGDVSWSNKGGKIAFLSTRGGNRTQAAYVLPLQKPAAGTTPAAGDIDFDDIHLRAERVGPAAADACLVSPDGTKVAIRAEAPSGGARELWVAAADGSNVTRVTQSGAAPTNMYWSRTQPAALYFLDGTGSLRLARTGPAAGVAGLLAAAAATQPSGRGRRSADSTPTPSTDPNEPQTIGFSAKLTTQRDAEFLQMFDQSWRLLADNFYDDKFGGSDWPAVRAKYRTVVGHLTHKEDLYALVSLMLGELNASHLGISGPTATVEAEQTPDLGLLFDATFAGPGLKVAEVIARGPADKRGLKIAAGDVVLAIDDVDVTPGVEVAKLLNGKTGETVRLALADADPKKPRRTVEVQPASRTRVNELMYDRWVAGNARKVSDLSGGKLGYAHIPSMDDAGLEKFVRSLYSDNFDRDGLVIDVRFNGGGFTHDQVLNYLTGKQHTVFRQRNGGEGSVIRSFDRKWSRPMVLLINNRSYSDAEIFPNGFRTLGLGKLVGVPTGGYVVGTTNTRLIDGSTFRLPRTGVFTAKGVDMDKVGVAPDVLVDATPADAKAGRDAQLETAVTVLLGDLKAAPAVPKTAGGSAPVGPAGR